MGGANSLNNLWAQPEINKWNGANYGFREKDKLESYLCAKVKSGTIGVREAQEMMRSDWVKYYKKFIGNKLGSENFHDGEDEINVSD